MAKKYDGITWNNLTLTHVAWPNIARKLSAENTLSLSHYTVVDHKIKQTFNELILTDTAEANTILYVSASNNLTLSHSAARKGTLSVSVESELELTHGARNSLHVERVNQQLELTHVVTVTGRPHYVSASNNLSGDYDNLDLDNIFDVDVTDQEALEAYLHTLGLRQEVSLAKSTFNVSAINYLSLSQQAAPTQVGIASNHLHLSQTVELCSYETVISYLKFQQEAICHKVQGIEQVLNLTHEAIIVGSFPRTASNTLNLKSVVSYIIVNFCDYTPGIGEGNFDYTPPSYIVPTLVRRETTILTWPYTSPMLTLELRNPNFDNIEQFEFRRINRRTKGGTLDLYRDETWPKVERLIMSFSRLSDTQRVSLFTFLQKSIGQEIGLLDFESRQWKGFILTPTTLISEAVKQGHSVSLEFEGELV